MDLAAVVLKGLDRRLRMKAALLSAWFFLTIVTLSILKPVRVASLLVSLGSTETPYVRLAGVATIGVVVMLYSYAVNRLSRIGVVRWSSLLFGAVLVLFWGALQVWGAALGGQRAFVWAVYILVEIYSVTMVGIFWTYTNDVVTESESSRLYGVIGLGGIVGGIAGGAFVDAFAKPIGPVHLLLVCAGLVAAAAALASGTEAYLRPPPRKPQDSGDEPGLADAFAGAREVQKSTYLRWLVLIVIAYEFTATLTDFSVSVLFEGAFSDKAEMTQMYGRLGWISSVIAVTAQLVLVPLLLPRKRIALLVPPAAMLLGAGAALAVPMVATAMLLGSADRGLNYSVQQSVKESLYVPLSDTQKYKTKAFIDMFVDRAAKAGAAFTLIALIHYWGKAPRPSIIVGLASMMVWFVAAERLGVLFQKDRVAPPAATPPKTPTETRARPPGEPAAQDAA